MSHRRGILIALAIIVAGLYFSGRLDYVLYPAGLNFHACARNGFGATFCGPDLTAYDARLRNAARQARMVECQVDPQLPGCSRP